MLASKCALGSTSLFECYKDADVEVVVRALASAGAEGLIAIHRHGFQPGNFVVRVDLVLVVHCIAIIYL